MQEHEGIGGRGRLAALLAVVAAVGIILAASAQRAEAQPAPAAEGRGLSAGQGQLREGMASRTAAVDTSAVDAQAVDACDDTQGGCANVAYWKPTLNPSTGEWDIMLNDFKGAFARFAFKGTKVEWITAKSPAGGETLVYLDGKKVKTFDAYSRALRLDQVGYSKTGLANKKHSLILLSAGKNPASSGNKSFIDEFRVGSTAYQQDSYRITYGLDFSASVFGFWTGLADSRAYGGSYRVSDSTTVPASFYFPKGPNVGIKTAVGPNYGEMYVEVLEYDPATGASTFVGSKVIDTHARSIRFVTRNITSVTNNGVEQTLDANKQYSVNVFSNVGDPVVIDGWTGDLP